MKTLQRQIFYGVISVIALLLLVNAEAQFDKYVIFILYIGALFFFLWNSVSSNMKEVEEYNQADYAKRSVTIEALKG